MPRKPKRRNPSASPNEVWIAPRPANTSEPRTFELIGIDRSNRYLEFADIALGAKMTSSRRKKRHGTLGNAQSDRDPGGGNAQADRGTGGKVTPINSHNRPNFGAFRNSR
jgi:hypothetical protein